MNFKKKQDFDPKDYPRYRFTEEGVFLGNRKLKVQHGPDDYLFYKLQNSRGQRVNVSAYLAEGKVVKIGETFFTQNVPEGSIPHPSFPMYSVDFAAKKVYQIGFHYPRRIPKEVLPQGGPYTLTDFLGVKRKIEPDNLFIH